MTHISTVFCMKRKRKGCLLPSYPRKQCFMVCVAIPKGLRCLCGSGSICNALFIVRSSPKYQNSAIHASRPAHTGRVSSTQRSASCNAKLLLSVRLFTQTAAPCVYEHHNRQQWFPRHCITWHTASRRPCGRTVRIAPSRCVKATVGLETNVNRQCFEQEEAVQRHCGCDVSPSLGVDNKVWRTRSVVPAKKPRVIPAFPVHAASSPSAEGVRVAFNTPPGELIEYDPLLLGEHVAPHPSQEPWNIHTPSVSNH